MSCQKKIGTIYKEKNVKEKIKRLSKGSDYEKIILISWICSKGDIYLLKYLMTLDVKLENLTEEEIQKIDIFPKVLSYTKKYNQYVKDFCINSIGNANWELLLDKTVVNLFKNEDYENISKLQVWYDFSIRRNALENC